MLKTHSPPPAGPQAQLAITDFRPIAKIPSFEYIAANPISAEKSRHSTPNDALGCERAYIMIFDSQEVAVYQTTKMPRANPTLSASDI
jgi:hypothetical protein